MEDKPRVLRSKKDGYIYWWTEILASRDDMEEIPFEEAFPSYKKPEPETDTVLPPKSKVYSRRSRK